MQGVGVEYGEQGVSNEAFARDVDCRKAMATKRVEVVTSSVGTMVVVPGKKGKRLLIMVMELFWVGRSGCVFGVGELHVSGPKSPAGWCPPQSRDGKLWGSQPSLACP